MYRINPKKKTIEEILWRFYGSSWQLWEVYAEMEDNEDNDFELRMLLKEEKRLEDQLEHILLEYFSLCSGITAGV
jgi:hypothetical protein